MKEFTIGKNDAGQRLDRWLAKTLPLLPAPLAQKDKHIHVIGDASKVGNLRSVIWGAWDVCMKI